jgi:hypothetical protein
MKKMMQMGLIALAVMLLVVGSAQAADFWLTSNSNGAELPLLATPNNATMLPTLVIDLNTNPTENFTLNCYLSDLVNV